MPPKHPAFSSGRPPVSPSPPGAMPAARPPSVYRLARGLSIGVSLGLGCACAPATAAEIATDPGDYAALPPGTDLAIVYAQYAERKTFYANGQRIPGNPRLDTQVGLLRWVHFMKLGDYVIDPQIILPFGEVQLKSALGQMAPTSASGVGDPMAGGTLWLVNEAERRRWFGLSAFVSLPAGRYEAAKGPVNLGENRWKGIFQAGYVQGLSANWTLDLIGEYAVYGDNDNFMGLRKSQKDSYGIQAHLRYAISPATHLALSYFHDLGGETRLNGIAQNDRMNNGRVLLTFATFVTPTVQWQVQAGQSAKVENGGKEDARINLRLVKVF